MQMLNVIVFVVAALMVIGMIGSFMFILIQLILLIDFAHAWNERWLSNYEESQSKVWFTGKRTILYYNCLERIIIIKSEDVYF